VEFDKQCIRESFTIGDASLFSLNPEPPRVNSVHEAAKSFLFNVTALGISPVARHSFPQYPQPSNLNPRQYPSKERPVLRAQSVLRISQKAPAIVALRGSNSTTVVATRGTADRPTAGLVNRAERRHLWPIQQSDARCSPPGPDHVLWLS
jgi:hypothetical protein